MKLKHKTGLRVLFLDLFFILESLISSWSVATNTPIFPGITADIFYFRDTYRTLKTSYHKQSKPSSVPTKCIFTYDWIGSGDRWQINHPPYLGSL